MKKQKQKKRARLVLPNGLNEDYKEKKSLKSLCRKWETNLKSVFSKPWVVNCDHLKFIVFYIEYENKLRTTTIIVHPIE